MCQAEKVEPEPTEDEQGRPFITLATVAKHKTRNDIWLSIHDKVYNVTEYMENHPGGEEVLMDRAGAIATEDFEDVGHSRDARKQLDKYELGMLPPSERAAKKSDDGSSEGGGAGIMAVPVLLAAIGAGYYYYNFMM